MHDQSCVECGNGSDVQRGDTWLDLQKIMFDAIKHRTNITLEQWRESTRSFEFRPIYRKRLAAVLMTRGPEVHISTTPEYKGRGLSKRILNEAISEIKGKHGYVVTRVADGHEIGHRLARMIGFSVVSVSDGVTVYKLGD